MLFWLPFITTNVSSFTVTNQGRIIKMAKRNCRWCCWGLLLMLLFSVVGVAQVQAAPLADMEYEEYRSQLELEYFLPFIMYDGVAVYATTYLRMSSILRDQELDFI